MSAEFLAALVGLAPYVAIFALLCYALAKIFGFQPIEIAREHGVIVAITLLICITAVALVALDIARNTETSETESFLENGARLKTFEANNAASSSVVARVTIDDSLKDFRVELDHRATNDRELAYDICEAYSLKLTCEPADGRSSAKNVMIAPKKAK